MTFDEFMSKVVATFPNADVGEDNEGQLVIYTGLQFDKDTRTVERIPEYED